MKFSRGLIANRVGACALIVLASLISTSFACGADDTSADPDGNVCVVDKENGDRSRIKPRNSGYGCAAIRSILLVLPNEVGVWSVEASAPGRSLTCRIFPRSSYPLQIRCRNGKRYFEVVAIT